MVTDGSLSESTVHELLDKNPLFAELDAGQKSSFLDYYRKEKGTWLQSFKKGDLLCRKGKYELDLCIILRGGVQFWDEVTGQGPVNVGTRQAPDFFGEAGAMGNLPRSSDVRAFEDSDILYIDRSALSFLLSNPKSRQLLQARYEESVLRIVAQQADLFRGVSKDFVEGLITERHFELLSPEAGETIIREGDPGDDLFIIHNGWVQISRRNRDNGSSTILAYRGPGDYIGEMALFAADKRRNATALAAEKCELVKLKYSDFEKLLTHYGAERAVKETIDRRREAEKRVTPELENRLRDWGQLNLIQNDALLVMDLDLCVKCDNCVKACETLHGESRLLRSGIQLEGRQLENYLVPAACSHCDDPRCMSSCPTGAVKRRPEGEIYFDYDICVGCQNCSKACPYDNIAMIATQVLEQAQEHKERTLRHEVFRPSLVKEPKDQYPIKCDLCDELPFMGCVHNCPTGAAIRIDPRTLFDRTGAVTAAERTGVVSTTPLAGKAIEAPTRKGYKACILALISSVVVVLVAAVTTAPARTASPYWTGLYTLFGFALAGLYSLRKRTLWFSVRWLELANRLARVRTFGNAFGSALRYLDNLERWRSAHIVLGVAALLPLCWHILSAPVRPNAVEWILLGSIILMVASGILGVLVQDFLARWDHTHWVPLNSTIMELDPEAMKNSPNRPSTVYDFFPGRGSDRNKRGQQHWVRLKDVGTEIASVLRQNRETLPGKSQNVLDKYHSHLEPIMANTQPFRRLIWATIWSKDPAEKACASARKTFEQLIGPDKGTYGQLLELAQAKVRLEQNAANLRFIAGWLYYHIAAVVVMTLVLVLHILGAFLFAR